MPPPQHVLTMQTWPLGQSALLVQLLAQLVDAWQMLPPSAVW
jgi:hypothetical protein